MRIESRARGALMGLAVGDALGTTQEFTRPRDRLPFPQLNLGPQTGIVGGGPFKLEAGQVTDDTQMAVCLAESLRERRRFDGDDLLARYRAWMAVAFDVGNQTEAALQSGSALEVWEQSGRHAAGNGSLMRTAPAAVFFAEDLVLLRRAAIGDSLLTHPDPRCLLACAAYDRAIAHALTDPQATGGSMLAAARAELGEAAEAVREPRIPEQRLQTALSSLGEDLAAAEREDPELDVLHAPGFVRTAFRLAFWELLHTTGPEQAVLDAANRGGDTDTNAAIAGALCGALWGEPAIPPAWWSSVEGFGRGAAESPWADRYHPRRLLALTVR